MKQKLLTRVFGKQIKHFLSFIYLLWLTLHNETKSLHFPSVLFSKSPKVHLFHIHVSSLVSYLYFNRLVGANICSVSSTSFSSEVYCLFMVLNFKTNIYMRCGSMITLRFCCWWKKCVFTWTGYETYTCVKYGKAKGINKYVNMNTRLGRSSFLCVLLLFKFILFFIEKKNYNFSERKNQTSYLNRQNTW